MLVIYKLKSWFWYNLFLTKLYTYILKLNIHICIHKYILKIKWDYYFTESGTNRKMFKIFLDHLTVYYLSLFTLCHLMDHVDTLGTENHAWHRGQLYCSTGTSTSPPGVHHYHWLPQHRNTNGLTWTGITWITHHSSLVLKLSQLSSRHLNLDI